MWRRMQDGDSCDLPCAGAETMRVRAVEQKARERPEGRQPCVNEVSLLVLAQVVC